MTGSEAGPYPPRVIAREYDTGRSSVLSSLFVPASESVTIRLGRAVALGDDALEIGADPIDAGVSREAVNVRCSADGWEIAVVNQRGVMLQPWGMAAIWVEPQSVVTRRSARLGIRVLGSKDDIEHWVLLENDAYAARLDSPVRDGLHAATDTSVERPPPLSAKQEAAIRLLFSQYLEWPCRSNPQTTKLLTVARTLDLSNTGVTKRLEPAVARAQRLGLHEQFGVTQPDYVYTLVAHGYLSPPAARIDADRFE